MSTLQLGPLALPIELVAFAIAGWVGLTIGSVLGAARASTPSRCCFA